MRFSRFSIRICHRCIKSASCREAEGAAGKRAISAFLGTILHRRGESRRFPSPTHPLVLDTLSAENRTTRRAIYRRERIGETARARFIWILLGCLPGPLRFCRRGRKFTMKAHGRFCMLSPETGREFRISEALPKRCLDFSIRSSILGPSRFELDLRAVNPYLRMTGDAIRAI